MTENKDMQVKCSLITIHYRGNLQKIKTAVICANSLLNDPKFFHAISACEDFDMASVPPAQIAELIHINVFRSEWTISGIVNTIIHQTVHAVNDLYPELHFGHGDRKSEGKENTAPYKIASIAEEMLTGKACRMGMIHEAPPETLAMDTLN
jgi:hypothetical protein